MRDQFIYLIGGRLNPGGNLEVQRERAYVLKVKDKT